MNGYQTAYGVVRRLHEVGGFEQLFAVERDIVKEGERVGHASLGCGGYDSVGRAHPCTLKYNERGE